VVARTPYPGFEYVVYRRVAAAPRSPSASACP
jgi:hypothetical protein